MRSPKKQALSSSKSSIHLSFLSPTLNPKSSNSTKLLHRDIGSKAINGLKSLGTSIVSTEKQRPQPITKAPPPDLFGGGLVGGLLGKAVGSMMKGVAEQMRQQQERSEELLSRARFTIQNDSKLQDYLGSTIQIGNPISQSSMTQVINGRSSQKTSLLLPIYGSKGGAQAQGRVDEVDGDVRISVQLPSGRVIDLGAVGSAGKTIDVDYKEL
jgi:hypothetical protein